MKKIALIGFTTAMLGACSLLPQKALAVLMQVNYRVLTVRKSKPS